jgi:hypothetical protein
VLLSITTDSPPTLIKMSGITDPSLFPETTPQTTRSPSESSRQAKGRGKPPKGKNTSLPDNRRSPTESEGNRLTSLENEMAEIKDQLSQLVGILSHLPGAPTVPSRAPSRQDSAPVPPIRPEDPILPTTEQTTSPDPTHLHETERTERIQASETPLTVKLPRKTELTEKIKPLDDGEEPTFRQWQASVRDRLEVNSDHYQTEHSRRALIWGTTTGLAKSYLEPQYLSDDHGFQTADEMISLLSSYFLTGNETEQARNRFDDMQMCEKGYTAETFTEFKARFQNAAIQGQVTRSEWFRFMWNKLTPQLRSASAMQKLQWNGEYHTMIRQLTAFDSERRRNAELNPNSLKITGTSRKSPMVNTGTSSYKPTKPLRTGVSFTRTLPNTATRVEFPGKSPDKPNNIDRTKSSTPAAAGNCYRCGKPGHFQDKCPLNPGIQKIDGADSEDDEESWEETVELQESDEILEENDEA